MCFLLGPGPFSGAFAVSFVEGASQSISRMEPQKLVDWVDVSPFTLRAFFQLQNVSFRVCTKGG